MPTSSGSAVSFSACPASSTNSSSDVIPVTIEVPAKHPLLLLKGELAWPQLEEITAKHWQASGKNVDGGRGRPFDVAFYTRVIVLMLILRLHSRELERELKENAVARLFVEVPQPTEALVRDHANLDRTARALGAAGMEELNALILNKAMELKFADPEVLSADTTAQELPIGYPNEPGIFRQAAQRIGRVLERLKKIGVKIKDGALEPVKQLLRLVKEHHLFAKTKEERHAVLEQIIEQGEQMAQVAEELGEELVPRPESVLKRAGAKLGQLSSFIRRLTPQVRSWMHSGKVAKDKLLHAGLEQARALVRNKAGKKWEFGFKWLIAKLGGGYVFGQMFTKASGESRMPVLAVKLYKKLLGAALAPALAIYDRGGWAKKTIQDLFSLGVTKIGIQPKGQASWLVEGADRDTVRSERGMTEGVIGTLKGNFYGFNKPKQRSTQNIELAGQGSLVSLNLNKLLRDIQMKLKTV